LNRGGGVHNYPLVFYSSDFVIIGLA
jgi:hypothetical protein